MHHVSFVCCSSADAMMFPSGFWDEDVQGYHNKPYYKYQRQQLSIIYIVKPFEQKPS